jgi:hypothetical protein
MFRHFQCIGFRRCLDRIHKFWQVNPSAKLTLHERPVFVCRLFFHERFRLGAARTCEYTHTQIKNGEVASKPRWQRPPQSAQLVKLEKRNERTTTHRQSKGAIKVPDCKWTRDWSLVEEGQVSQFSKTVHLCFWSLWSGSMKFGLDPRWIRTESLNFEVDLQLCKLHLKNREQRGSSNCTSMERSNNIEQRSKKVGPEVVCSKQTGV